MTKTNAAEMANHRKKGHLGTKGLWIILAILGLAIIGLVVWIVMAKVNEGASSHTEEHEPTTLTDGSSDGSEYPPRTPQSPAAVAYSEASTILDSQAPNAYADAMQLFDKAVASASAQDEVFYIETTRINLLLNHGYYNEAIPYIDKISNDASGPNEQYTIYALYEEAYKGLGDAEASKQYNTLRQEALAKINQELYDTQE